MDATIRGIRTHWEEAGSGQLVLLVHAFPFSSRMWTPQLAAVPGGWRFVAPDLRGFGRTEAGPGDEPLAMDVFADDLVALLDHLGEEKAVVCGLSMGGYISFALWRRHPERIRALVLCDTRASADGEEGRAARYAIAERALTEGMSVVADVQIPRVLSDTTRQTKPEVVAVARDMIEATSPNTFSRAQHGMAARPDSTALLPHIHVPTLVIVGDEDVTTPPADSEAMVAALPNARLVRIPGAGHLSNLEAPEAFNSALAGFLAGITA